MLNLRQDQKEALRWIVERIEAQKLGYEFDIQFSGGPGVEVNSGELVPGGTDGVFNALVTADCLQSVPTPIPPYFGRRRYAITDIGTKAIKSNFAEPEPASPAQTFATTIHGGTGFQFGNHNRMDVKAAVEAIGQIIHESTTAPEKKEEAKSAWKKFVENSAVKEILEIAVTGTVKALKD